MSADPLHAQVYDGPSGDILRFKTESMIPSKTDFRPPLLFVAGNPAPHSAFQGICFASERQDRPHRFWSVLSETGLLVFERNEAAASVPSDDSHEWIDDFYALRYSSQFRVGIAVYFSMPTSSNAKRWAGVAGLRALFGRKAFERISLAEELRVASAIETFCDGRGLVVALQKDAYERLRASSDPPYRLSSACQGGLVARYRKDGRVPLLGLPPTRYMHSEWTKRALRRISLSYSG
jgi:hypothetical protein